MVKVWRNKSRNSLYARRIQRVEFPRLVDAMKDDMLDCRIEDTGLVWSIKGYRIASSEVARNWGITYAQMKRFQDYIYEKDPWYAEYR